MVRRWHKKSGSMSGMSEAVHAKASRCRAITSQFDHVPPDLGTCQAWTSFPQSPFPTPPLLVQVDLLGQPLLGLPCTPLSSFSSYSHNTSLLPSDHIWLLSLFPQGRVTSSSNALLRLLPLLCLGQVCPKEYCKLKGRWQQGTLY